LGARAIGGNSCIATRVGALGTTNSFIESEKQEKKGNLCWKSRGIENGNLLFNEKPFLPVLQKSGDISFFSSSVSTCNRWKLFMPFFPLLFLVLRVFIPPERKKWTKGILQMN